MIRLLVLPCFTLLIGFALSNYDSYQQNAVPAKERSYPEHLTGTFTGGFGEEICRSCHFDYDINPEGGSLTVGVPKQLPANKAIKIPIKVERKELGAAGFQLSARYEDGSQAGRFLLEGNDRVMFTESVGGSLQYVQHSSEGTTPSQEDTARWTVKWLAPDSPKGPVIFNIAANAANGDQSEFGDFIYSKEVKTTLSD